MAQGTAPSAPAYEPDIWNNKTTPEQRAAFIKDNRQTLITILAVADRGRLPDENDLYRYESNLSRNPDFQALEAVAGFVEADERLGGDNQKLAEKFGLKVEQVPALRATMQTMRDALGYQDYANCYTYAMNDLDGLASRHKSLGGDDPGTRGGTDPENTDVNWDKVRASNSRDYEAYKRAVMQGVLADGAVAGGADAEPKDGQYRVAVFTKRLPEGSPSSAPALDMHFIRENKGGGWSHKPDGYAPVTDKDATGKPITDPKTASIGGYDFLGYVYVPEGGLDVGRRGEPATKPGSIRMEEERKASPAAYGAFPDLAGMAAQIVPQPATSSPDPAPAAEARKPLGSVPKQAVFTP